MPYERFTFLWRAPSPFSRWTRFRFAVREQDFTSAEQLMMHGKALLFGDVTSAQRILDTDSPAHQRALGRKVEHFDNALWQRERELLVYQGNHAGFTQNQAYLEALLATAGTELVEASPRDSIWALDWPPTIRRRSIVSAGAARICSAKC